MASSNTVELARKGDPKAIAALMNKSLGAKGVLASAIRQGSSLEITLQSQRALNQKTMVDIVQKGMRNLQVSAIERVLIRSEQGNVRNWESEIFLNQTTPQVLKEPAPEPVPTHSPVNATKPSISQAIQTSETKVSSPVNPSQSRVDMVLLPKLSQLNHSVQKYQDTVVRLTDDTGRDIICLCTLAELMRTLYAPSSAQQSIADAINQCSSTNGDGEKIIRNVSILQPGQMWQKILIRCTLQIAFEMEGTSNLAENLTNSSIYESEDEEDTVLESTPAINTEETLLEYPTAHGEDGGEDTVIESISPAKAQEYESDKTKNVVPLQTRPKLSEEEDETVIEGISPAKAQEYENSQHEAELLLETLQRQYSKLSQPEEEDDTVVEAPAQVSPVNQDLFGDMGTPEPDVPVQSEDDVLFPDFVFDATHPPKTISDIDTISDPAVPPPPQDLSFTLEDFRSDLLSIV